jgi:hypothetical protein
MLGARGEVPKPVSQELDVPAERPPVRIADFVQVTTGASCYQSGPVAEKRSFRELTAQDF